MLAIDRPTVTLDDMSTAPAEIAARLRRALEKAGKSQRAVEKATGMSKGYLSRLASEEGYGDVSVRWLAAVARELGVRFEWLAEGQGPMVEGERTVEYDARYPNFARAADAARALGLRDEAISRMASAVGSTDYDPEPFVWLDKIRLEDALVRREELGLALDKQREADAEKRDAARAAEAEQASKPKLPKRRGHS